MIPSDEWTDYALDGFEFAEITGELVKNRPLEPGAVPDAALIQQYFAENLYPYSERMQAREYLQIKHRLQVELVKLQNWVAARGQRLIVIFEGRDAAGKGSTIKRFMEHLNPRVARVVALVKPTDVERSQWYFQRYVAHLPHAGEIVFFDRSWYNRAGVERVMGFCTDEEYHEFVRQAPLFEEMLAKSGIHIIKFYLSVSREEQQARFHERQTNPLKHWKLSPIDQEAQIRWDAYTEAKEDTFRQTDSEYAPWVILKSEDKLRARLEAIRYTLLQFDYTDRDLEAIGALDALLISPVAQLAQFRDD